MKKCLIVLCGILMLVGLAGCHPNIHTKKDGSAVRNYQKDIDAIYYCHWDALRTMEDTAAYKIDLKNNAFYEIASGAEFSKDQWGTTEGDADFKLVSALENDDVDSFFAEIARHGMTLWERSYRDDTILDGSTWYIKIVFSDQTIMESSGINQYPETWEKVMEDFENLTGRAF